jgi:hypothetical protein
MRIARKFRPLLDAEKEEAAKVFEDSLPSWGRIVITDGLGPIPGFDNPYTDDVGPFFHINVGPDIYDDLMWGNFLPGFGLDRNIFIHEMTHVWQYYHGYHVILSSVWANATERVGIVPDAYAYTAGHAWDSYNVEQQAHLVEDWYKASDGNMSVHDVRFVYIEKIIRAGLSKNSLLPRFKDTLLIKLSAQELREL